MTICKMRKRKLAIISQRGNTDQSIFFCKSEIITKKFTTMFNITASPVPSTTMVDAIYP